MSAAIETQNLTRRFGAVAALDGVSLSIAKGEFFSLLGPSGCGKTTLLRIIAGLETPDGGTLQLNGNDALGVPAHRRPVNTVFQSYALFPHMTVAENVAFGLKMKKVARTEIPNRVQRVMELVDIAGLSGRRPSQISGGQKQRVALARALVNEPEILLLDEPLGALDLKLRKQLQIELRQLQRRVGITFVYVTHDQEEAMAMSDRIAVMNHGRIEQIGPPDQVYDRPGTQGETLLVKTPFGEASVNWAGGAGGDSVLLTVRPENFLLREGATAGGGVCGKVVSIVYNGSQTHYEIQVSELTFKAVLVNAHGVGKFQVGDEVAVSVPSAALRMLQT